VKLCCVWSTRTSVGIWCDRARDDLIACASERTTQHDRLEFQTLSYSKFYDQGQSPGLRVCYHMYLRVPCDVFKYAFMCTGTPASYAVCQASSSLILSILASYAVCQIALTAAIATGYGPCAPRLTDKTNSLISRTVSLTSCFPPTRMHLCALGHTSSEARAGA
jgi:hypothetical protein